MDTKIFSFSAINILSYIQVIYTELLSTHSVLNEARKSPLIGIDEKRHFKNATVSRQERPKIPGYSLMPSKSEVNMQLDAGYMKLP